MNELTFAERHYRYEIDGIWHSYGQTEFVVDGRDLSVWLGISDELPWFGVTRLTERELADDARIEELSGRAIAVNQFGSGRLVLYGCHCGCDYCGVISCIVTRDGHSVTWSDIRCEEDDFLPEINRVGALSFNIAQMDRVLATLRMKPLDDTVHRGRHHL